MTKSEEIAPLIERELKRMDNKYPLKYNSLHEAYAVTMEEIEESCTEVLTITEISKLLWGSTKCDNKKAFLDFAEELKKASIRAIAELVQVCACCDKCKRKGM